MASRPGEPGCGARGPLEAIVPDFVVKRGDLIAPSAPLEQLSRRKLWTWAQVPVDQLLRTAKDGKTVDYGSIIGEGAILAKIDESVYAAELAWPRPRWNRTKRRNERRRGFRTVESQVHSIGSGMEASAGTKSFQMLAGADFDTYKPTLK